MGMGEEEEGGPTGEEEYDGDDEDGSDYDVN